MTSSTHSECTTRLDQIQEALGCKGLELCIRDEWGARTNPHYRRSIRDALAHRFSDPSLNDLMKLPDLAEVSISISHSGTRGGYALCQKDVRVRAIGFDIELASRIRPDIILRLTTPDELQYALAMAPHPEFIWAAKEAAFKSLRGPDQPAVLTDLLIRPDNQNELKPEECQFSWRFGIEMAQSGRPVLGRGLVFKQGELIYGFFSLQSEAHAK